jgi:phenylpropionate dioxygenase-like ring-hydroxylating dioxygenase large terminal subunit
VYPFGTPSSFVHDAWYVVAWSAEITAQPIARRVLDEPIVLFRGEDRTVVALADRCPHRGFPLSKGTFDGDRFTCGYHGFSYDRTGTCVAIPSQDRVPPGIRVRAYPVVERWQWVWVWMGDPDAAQLDLIPDHDAAGLTRPDWESAIGGAGDVACRYELFNENLLDLTHLTFLHPGTIGTPQLARSPVTVETSGRVVTAVRFTRDEELTPFYAKRLGVAAGRMDRRHRNTFVAPSFHVVHMTTFEAHSQELDAPRTYGEHTIVHALTPVTATSMRDFWAFARNYNPGAEIETYLRKTIGDVIRQDYEALEILEPQIAGTPLREYHCAADEPALDGRRAVLELLRAEERTAHDNRRSPIA